VANGDAFRHHEYGDRIIVERVIRHNGTSDYRLKRKDGHVVSNAKADLDAMLDHLNIQVGLIYL
jgi:hypothetical protein